MNIQYQVLFTIVSLYTYNNSSLAHASLPCMHIGHGIPNQKATNKRTAMLDPSLVPLPSDAVANFHATGGHLQLVSEFGKDPLDGASQLQQIRQATFTERYPSMDPLFSNIANNDRGLFQEALLYFIRINERLSSTINV